MNIPSVKFNTQDQPEFFKELRNRVNLYFKENNISKHANIHMKIKTGFMLCLYFIPFLLMVTGVISSIWLVFLMWAIMGLGMSGIGMSVMHDAIHGAYSKNQKVNNVMGYLIHIIGGYKLNWKIQHNVLHHSFTNVDGFDEDIDTGLLRMSPNQKRMLYHKFQIIYAPLLYGLMTIYWATGKDFEQIVRYSKKNLLDKQGMTLKQALIQIIYNKAIYFTLLLVIPLIFVGVAWWQTLLGFLLMHFICGIILAFIFQSAHVIEETHFFKADETGSVENNWAIHQMKTTSNFANTSRIFSWCIGGLNYQIEHHLFPHICHVHYRKISKIIKETASEFSVPYNQHKTFLLALRSHFNLIYQLGTGQYDRKLVKA